MFLYLSIIRVALRNLMANKMRSLLTMLGIIIGVGSVTAMLSIGEGAQGSVIADVKSWGTNRLSLRPGNRGRGGVQVDRIQSFRLPDALAILRDVPEIDMVAPEVRGNAQAKFGSRNARCSLVGSSNTMFTIFNYEIARGRSFLEAEEKAMRRVCVIGPKVVEKLFGREDAPAVGETIKINGEQYLVVGVTKSKGDQGWFNPDDQIFLPYSTMMKRVLGSPDLWTIHMHVVDENMVMEAEEKVREAMRRQRRLAPGRPDDFIINNSAEFLQDLEKFMLVFKLLLTGIAGISLLVGGIGIMNIMLVTVTERTREIGIRKALGAKDRTILFQFVIEAIIVCVIGGLIGILSGAGIVWVFNAATAHLEDMFRASVSEQGVMLGLIFSVAVGLFFGIYPAAKASRLDPIEALRHE